MDGIRPRLDTLCPFLAAHSRIPAISSFARDERRPGDRPAGARVPALMYGWIAASNARAFLALRSIWYEVPPQEKRTVRSALDPSVSSINCTMVSLAMALLL